MTIGQRIAQLRKEHHLSQEELGSKLGVSRQAIYKWESDGSLPEIDKLIALSKLFEVSVGELLGVEEPAAQAESPELTEQQMEMVRRIADKYLAAQPRHFRHQKAVLAAAALVLVGGIFLGMRLYGRMGRMQQDYQALLNQVNNIDSSVDRSVSQMSQRVEQILKSQNRLTSEYSAQVVSVDPAANTVTLEASAVPKTYSEGMQAVFTATQAETGEITEAAGVPDSRMEFKAQLTCPLSDDITLSVTFVTADKRENQYLEEFTGLYAGTVPSVSVEASCLVFAEPNEKGFLDLKERGDCLFMVRNYHEDWEGQAKIESIRVGLFLNKKLLCWAEPVDSAQAPMANFEAQWYQLPEDLKILMTREDTLSVATLVSDEYGREHFQLQDCFALCDDGWLNWADSSRVGGVDSDGWTY